MTIIGREPPADIVIPAPQVSARHAEIVAVGGDVYELTDLGSTNGVFVNGVRTLRGRIRRTDDVKLGSYALDLRAILMMVGGPAGSPLYSVPAVAPVPSPNAGALGYVIAAPSVPLLYAGFWLRFVASFLDSLVVFVISMGVGIVAVPIVLRFVLSRAVPSLGALEMAPVGLVIGVLAGWLYYSLFESSERRATPGKMAVGIRVSDLAGRRLSFGRATGRSFAKYVSNLTLCIGYVMVAFTDRKQALHDLIAGTIVTRKPR